MEKKTQNTYPNSFSLSYKWRKYQTMFNLAVIHSAFTLHFWREKKCKQRNRQLVYFLAFPNGLCINLFYYFFYIMKFLGKGLKGLTPNIWRWLFLGQNRLELLCCLSQACDTLIIKIVKDKNMHLGSFNTWFHKLFVLRVVLFCCKIINKIIPTYWVLPGALAGDTMGDFWVNVQTPASKIPTSLIHCLILKF